MSDRQMVGFDIGGTNTRAQLVTPDGAGEPVKLKNDQFKGIEGVLTASLDELGVLPENVERLVIAAAGPTDKPESFQFTNLDFGVINFPEMGKKIGAEIQLVNDFYAQGCAALTVKREDCTNLTPDIETKLPSEIYTGQGDMQRWLEVPEINRFVITGPGTGLGMALALVTPEQRGILNSEAGHCNFGVSEQKDLAPMNRIRNYFMQNHNHKGDEAFSYETFVRGDGMVHLYELYAASSAQKADSTKVVELARQGDKCAISAINAFTKIFGAAAGNLALAGMTLGGVIMPKGSIISDLGPLFNMKSFQEELARNDLGNNPIKGVPVIRMDSDETGLLGVQTFIQNKHFNMA